MAPSALRSASSSTRGRAAGASCSACEARDSTVRPVWPYSYASAVEEPTLREFVTRLASGQIDILVFTSRSQIDALYNAASSFGLRPTVEAGLLRARIAAVGPVVAA